MKGALSPSDDSSGVGYRDHKMGLYRPPSLRNSSVLVRWIKDHRSSPYPSKGDKQMLAVQAGMTLTQVSNWFANARRRIKKIGMEEWLEVHAGALTDRPLQPFRYPLGINFPPVSGYSNVGGFSLCGPPGATAQPPVYENPHTPQAHLPSFPPAYSGTNGSSMMHSPSYTLPPTPAGNSYHKTMLMSGGMHLPPTPNDTSAEHTLQKLQQTSQFTPFGPLSLLSPRMPAQSAMLPQWPMNSPQSATLPSIHQTPLAGLTHTDQRKDEPSSKSLSFGPGLFANPLNQGGLPTGSDSS